MRKNNLKRLTLALVAAGLSGVALADSGFNVVVPNQNGGFMVGLEGDYLQPGATLNNYAISSTGTAVLGSTLATLSTAQTVNNVDPEFDFGFGVNVGYRFPGTGNDVTLAYQHIHGSDSENLSAPVGGSIVDYFGGYFAHADQVASVSPLVAPPLGFNAAPLVRAHASVDTNLDRVDLDVGQRARFGSGNPFDLRMFAGLTWARVAHDLDTRFAGSAASTTTPGEGTTVASSTATALVVNNSSTFNGIGPHVGFDGRYCFGGSGIGFDAHAGAALLVGDIDASQTATGLTQQNLQTTVGSSSTSSSAAVATNARTSLDANGRVVPVLDASLGVDYTYLFNNCSDSSLAVQLGYKVANYFNVDRQANAAGAQVFDGDVSFAGPFLSVNFYA